MSSWSFSRGPPVRPSAHPPPVCPAADVADDGGALRRGKGEINGGDHFAVGGRARGEKEEWPRGGGGGGKEHNYFLFFRLHL